LGSYHRQFTVHRTSISLHFRALKNYPVAPKNLGEFLRQKRVDLGLSQRKLAEMLAIGSQIRPSKNGRRTRTARPNPIGVASLKSLDSIQRRPTWQAGS